MPAKQYAEAGGFQMPEPGSEAFRALCEGIARAQIENARFVLFRQGALLGNYQPQDELFQGASPQEPSAQHLQSSAPPILSISVRVQLAHTVNLPIMGGSSGMLQMTVRPASGDLTHRIDALGRASGTCSIRLKQRAQARFQGE